MTVKRKSRKILSDYKLTSSYKSALSNVLEYNFGTSDSPLNNWSLENRSRFMHIFDEAYKTEWAETFKFNTDRILYPDEQEKLNGILISQTRKPIRNLLGLCQ